MAIVKAETNALTAVLAVDPVRRSEILPFVSDLRKAGTGRVERLSKVLDW